jgi:nucleoid-associated protein EbfC
MSTDDLSGGLSGLDLGGLLGQVQAMQAQMAEAQQRAGETVVEGSAAGGKVVVSATGAGEFTAVRIDPSVVSADEVDLLEDLILAAVRDASTKIARLNAESMGDLTTGLGLGNLFGS